MPQIMRRVEQLIILIRSSQRKLHLSVLCIFDADQILLDACLPVLHLLICHGDGVSG